MPVEPGNPHPPSSTLRALATWQWVVAAIFFPMGIYAALGYAGLIRWSTAIMLVVSTYAAEMGLVFGLSRTLEESPQQSVILVALNCLLAGTGFFQYKVGVKHNYWSERGGRLWKIFGVLGMCSTAFASIVAIRAFAR